MKNFIPFLTCLLLGIIAVAVEASITINSGGFYANARDVDVNSESQGFNRYTIPTHATLSAAIGESSSSNSVDWDVSGGQTILSLGMDHKRPGSINSYAETRIFSLNFTANSNEPFALSGFYNVSDLGASGILGMYVFFTDVDIATLFENNQYSDHTNNEQLTLGGAGGDNTNYVFGSLTGNLIAGHDYHLRTDAYIQAYPDADSGASALGNITLTIGTAPGDFDGDNKADAADYVVWRHRNGPASEYEVWRANYGQPNSGNGSSIESATVPEPSSLVLLAIGAISLLGYRKAK